MFRRTMMAAMVLSALGSPLVPPAEGQTIRTPSGSHCVDLQGGNFVDRNPIQIYPCNGTAAQRWFPQVGNAGLRFLAHDGYWSNYRHVLMDMSAPYDWSPVWGFHGWGGSNQSWAIKDASFQLRNTNLCLLTPSAGNGAKVQFGPCGPQQAAITYTRPGDFRLPNGSDTIGRDLRLADGRCLDVWLANPADGTSVVAHQCHGGENQKWNVLGQISGLGYKCLTASYYYPSQQTSSVYGELKIGTCSSWRTQQFSVVGQLRSDGNQCLTRRSLYPVSGGSPLFVRRCDATWTERLSQIWRIDS